ncbi:MAG: homoserine dehydrogenase [Helicobacteraceae bacterium]|jgi:homoserine dehydrogenase|nr:homoserine dehydrogenase [Helicobacteraceae bacterium]
MLKIALVGVGTVGAAVADILRQNRSVISARAGKEIRVVKGIVKNTERKRANVDFPISADYREATDDPQIDAVVELMGGVEYAYEIVKAALKNKKAVVTANKALLAYRRYELEELAGGIPFAYEASVAGGIPIIRALRDGLSANHIESIRGVINGTCNYMLTRMFEKRVGFARALKEAQELGYAEADPTFDVGGFDAAHKLLIMASLAYGIDAKPEDMLIEGIGHLTDEDITFAEEFGYTIKSLAIAKKQGDKVSLRVHPAFISRKDMIAKVDGVMNGVSLIGDMSGETFYYGAGAGGKATASSVVADLIALARGETSPMLGFRRPNERKLSVARKDEIESKYYIRVLVEDVAGVLAQTAAILASRDISIETVLQRKKRVKKEWANLLLSTHKAREIDLIEALKEIGALSFVKSPPVMLRIES